MKKGEIVDKMTAQENQIKVLQVQIDKLLSMGSAASPTHIIDPVYKRHLESEEFKKITKDPKNRKDKIWYKVNGTKVTRVNQIYYEKDGELHKGNRQSYYIRKALVLPVKNEMNIEEYKEYAKLLDKEEARLAKKKRGRK